MAEGLPPAARDRANHAGLATVGDIEGTLLAVQAATRAPHPVSPQTPVDSAAGITTVIDEHAGKAILAAAGIDIPAGRSTAATPEAATAAAAEVGYPVAAKVIGIAHKTEVAGVHLDLGDDAALEAAVAHLATLAPTVLVEEFVGDDAIELLIDVRAEPPLGWLLTLGAGGTMTELLDDTTSILLPATPAEIRASLRTLRLGPRFDGHRGRPPVDLDPLIGMIEALHRLVTEDPSIREIELNPVLVTAGRAVAADTIIRREESPT